MLWAGMDIIIDSFMILMEPWKVWILQGDNNKGDDRKNCYISKGVQGWMHHIPDLPQVIYIINIITGTQGIQQCLKEGTLNNCIICSTLCVSQCLLACSGICCIREGRQNLWSHGYVTVFKAFIMAHKPSKYCLGIGHLNTVKEKKPQIHEE